MYVHGKWGGVAVPKALGPSISVMEGVEVWRGVWYVSPPRLMDRKYSQRNNNICKIYIQKEFGSELCYVYDFNKPLSMGYNPD